MTKTGSRTKALKSTHFDTDHVSLYRAAEALVEARDILPRNDPNRKRITSIRKSLLRKSQKAEQRLRDGAELKGYE
jgi:hypothetical protein